MANRKKPNRAENSAIDITIERRNFELVFAFAGPVGTDLPWARSVLEEELRIAGYRIERIGLSALLREITAKFPLFNSKGKPIQLEQEPEDERISTHMDAGNALRRQTNDPAALATFAISHIVASRKTRNNEASRTAYVLTSLKRPEEIHLLRRIYGVGFFLVGVFSPRKFRVRRLAELIAHQAVDNVTSERFPGYEKRATELVNRDESEGDPFGQKLRDAFPFADLFVSLGTGSGSDLQRATDSIKRFVELLLGNVEHTPTREEYLMFHAHAAALRSGSLSRQVGAVTATESGEIVGVGCNDVPKAGGGLYWVGDSRDERDIRRERDSSDEQADVMVNELLAQLHNVGWLTERRTVEEARQLVQQLRIMNLLEFGRTTHAEMEAVLSAARVGVSVSGLMLFTTTFPCHECARLILTSGISQVIFIEPYPKSLAVLLHEDSIDASGEVDSCDGRIKFLPFVGIGPHRYFDLFSMMTATGVKLARKDDRGYRKRWRADSAEPKLSLLPMSYLELEKKSLRELSEKLNAKKRRR